MYLLDTNIISETVRQSPSKSLLGWLSSTDSSLFFLSVLTFGEIRKGIEKLDSPSKKQRLTQWLEVDLTREFSGKVLAIDGAIAEKWGTISAHVAIPPIDGLIGASALVHNLTLVTRNTKDFSSIPGIKLINPWLNP